MRCLGLDRMIGQDSDVEHNRRCVRIDVFFNFNTRAKVKSATTVELQATTQDMLTREGKEAGSHDWPRFRRRALEEMCPGRRLLQLQYLSEGHSFNDR